MSGSELGQAIQIVSDELETLGIAHAVTGSFASGVHGEPVTSVDVDFLLAVLDSWDGSNGSPAPDIFNVRVDGTVVFSHTFAIASGTSDYTPPPGGLLSSGTNLGFNPSWADQAFNMYLEPALHGIAHTASTLTIDFYASGAGWQGGDDESWAIENVRVSANLVAATPR